MVDAGPLGAGAHRVALDVSALPAGVYTGGDAARGGSTAIRAAGDGQGMLFTRSKVTSADLRIAHFTHTPFCGPNSIRVLPDHAASALCESLAGSPARNSHSPGSKRRASRRSSRKSSSS